MGTHRQIWGFNPLIMRVSNMAFPSVTALGAAARACCHAARYSGTEPVCLMAKRGVPKMMGEKVSLYWDLAVSRNAAQVMSNSWLAQLVNHTAAGPVRQPDAVATHMDSGT
ncbi:hypothetical protein DSO57_1039709 [Entomophthora muscae]|uniref:Uncharacterized protein n=1 Tax=Entomophthora muscae TaxID=34485 RepID=A0ACC2T003_9FUNG|nr:hypothetical protein DSO57_1039709 [Entomophthora muscae]